MPDDEDEGAGDDAALLGVDEAAGAEARADRNGDEEMMDWIAPGWGRAWLESAGVEKEDTTARRASKGEGKRISRRSKVRQPW